MDTLPVRLQGADDRGLGAGLSCALWIAVLIFMPAAFLPAADVFVQSETVTGSKTVATSDGSIYAGPGYTINAPGNVTFKAFGEIDMKPGFTVSQGAVFRAYLIGTESDPDVRYGSVTGTVMLNGVGIANIALTMYGYNSYGRWVSRAALTDSRGGFAFTLAEGTYTLSEQADAYAFKMGEAGNLRVSGTGLAISPASTALVPTDTHLVYYHHDMLGNSVAMTNDSGGVIMRSVFYPFGDQYSTEGVGERYLFTGKERDATGLDYFGARYFEPSLGRFTGIDKMEGRIDEPQTWNRYTYCINNPYKYFDPDGNWGSSVHLDKTYEVAKEYVSEENARTIAASCNGVDSALGGKGPVPGIGKQSYHFNTNKGVPGKRDSRVEIAEGKLNKAISLYKQGRITEAMCELGEGTHALQDIPAHNPYQDELLGVCYHINPDADDTEVGTERLDETLKMTKDFFGSFINGIFDNDINNDKDDNKKNEALDR